MISIEDIINKEIELNNIIENLRWQYIKEHYDLHKGCVCLIQDSYWILDSIKQFDGYVIYLNFTLIKRNGEIGKRLDWHPLTSVIKQFENYEEYKKALQSL